jgi:glycosyltransferase involved in cell wall biosynthesis
MLIPCYNGEQYIEYCLESMVRQTHKDLEIIVCDDASTDDSVGRIKAFSKNHPDARIVLLELKKNSGPGTARNMCWKAATGKFCALQDADDASSHCRIEAQLAAIFKYKHPIVTCPRKPLELIGTKYSLETRPLAVGLLHTRGCVGGFLFPREPVVRFLPAWHREEVAWLGDMTALYGSKPVVKSVFYFYRTEAHDALRKEVHKSPRYYIGLGMRQARKQVSYILMDLLRPQTKPITDYIAAHSKPPED